MSGYCLPIPARRPMIRSNCPRGCAVEFDSARTETVWERGMACTSGVARTWSATVGSCGPRSDRASRRQRQGRTGDRAEDDRGRPRQDLHLRTPHQYAHRPHRRGGDHPVIRRCQLHKIRNVNDQLPQRFRSTVGRRMTDAYHADAALPSRAGPRGRRPRSSRGCARAQTAVIPDLLTRPLLHFNQKKDTKVQMHRPENCWRMASNRVHLQARPSNTRSVVAVIEAGRELGTVRTKRTRLPYDTATS
ncbi:hypothetical protein ACVWWN_000254 [Mycobacterium sp. URHB0021]